MRFIRSYVNHRPQFNPRASATPKLNAIDGISRNSISDFYLDSRTPGGGGSSSTLDLAAYDYLEEEAARERETERRVQELLKEVRIWRVANSAQWVAWGIVQAKVPELDAALDSETVLDGEAITEEPAQINGIGEHPKEAEDKRPEGLKAEAMLNGESVKEAEVLEDDEDEFDYLAYAQDRAMFFWGDVVGLGLVRKEELPERLGRGLRLLGIRSGEWRFVGGCVGSLLFAGFGCMWDVERDLMGCDGLCVANCMLHIVCCF